MTENKTTENSSIAYRVLIEPIITEAATVLAGENKYVFKIASKATKAEVKKAVEEIFKVSVLSVRTINVIGKKRMRGRIEGHKTGTKKAIVKIKEGESINIYENK